MPAGLKKITITPTPGALVPPPNRNRVATWETVMPFCRESKSMVGAVSKAVEDMTAVVRAPALGKPVPPPRLSAAQAVIEREAVEAVQAMRARELEKPTFERVSQTHDVYRAPPAEAYRTMHASHKGGHPSSIQLGPVEVPRASAPPPEASAAQAFGVTAQPEAYARGWYGSDPVVSEFSARLKHVPGPTSVAALTGIELSLALLFGRLHRRCADAKLDLGAFVAALARHATHSEGDDFVPSKLVRDLAHAVRLPFGDGDLEAVVAACSASREAPVSLGRLRGHLAAAAAAAAAATATAAAEPARGGH
jgi:hypothetical protein